MERSELIKLCLVIAVVLLTWASAFVGIRIGLTEYTPGSLALLRFLSASVGMMIFYAYLCQKKTAKQRPTQSEWLQLAVLGVLGFSVYSIALNHGELTVNAAISSFIISLSPVTATLMSVWFLGEQLDKKTYLGMFTSFIGVSIIVLSESEGAHFEMGVLYILLAMVCGASYTAFHKTLLKKYTPIEMAAYAIWFGTSLLLVYLPQLLHDFKHATFYVTAWVVYIGLFPSAVAFVCWAYVLKRLPVSKASSLLYILPILVTAMGYFLLGEVPKELSLIGGVIALLGSGLVNIKKFRWFR